jgi:rRNA maturation endonuclease Nob1
MESNKCPQCGEEENLHFNYDWDKTDNPILDIVCNECGAVFKPLEPCSVCGGRGYHKMSCSNNPGKSAKIHLDLE